MKPRTKTDCQRLHAKRRFAQRTHVRFGPRVEQLIINQIRQGLAVLVKKQSLRVRVYDVEHEGEKLRVVYDRNRKTIVTVLPKGP
jgi:hypothetical protein